MSEQRYGDYEQVNGATANAANDRAEKAEQQRDKLHEALRAAMDDTPGWYDLARDAIAEAEASK